MLVSVETIAHFRLNVHKSKDRGDSKHGSDPEEAASEEHVRPKLSKCITRSSQRRGATDNTLRTLINETNKFESRFGKIRDEKKMLGVKKLMLESLFEPISFSLRWKISSLTRFPQPRRTDRINLTQVLQW